MRRHLIYESAYLTANGRHYSKIGNEKLKILVILDEIFCLDDVSTYCVVEYTGRRFNRLSKNKLLRNANKCDVDRFIIDYESKISDDWVNIESWSYTGNIDLSCSWLGSYLQGCDEMDSFKVRCIDNYSIEDYFILNCDYVAMVYGGVDSDLFSVRGDDGNFHILSSDRFIKL